MAKREGFGYWYGGTVLVVGAALEITTWLISRSEAATRDPSIGLGLLFLAGALLAVAGLAALAVAAPRWWKLLPIVALIIFVGAGVLFWMRSESGSNALYQLELQKREPQSFRGTVSAVSTDCRVDGLCTATVNSETIITGCGLTFDDSACPMGNKAYADLQAGAQVQVTAIRMNDGRYSLHCNECGITKY